MSEPIDPVVLERLKRRAWVWPAIVIALLGGNVLVGAVTVYLAMSDPSAAVEPDYYRKALDWDHTAAQLRANTELGWGVELTVGREAGARGERTVSLALADRDGAPVGGAQVSYEAFPQARGNQRIAGTFDPRELGVYAGDLMLPRAGMWEFRFAIERGELRFTSVEKHFVWPTNGARP